QAPEDPLFGLMRAYRADPSPNKVDLVRQSCWRADLGSLKTPPSLRLTDAASRALARTATTTQSPGFCQWSRRCASFSNFFLASPKFKRMSPARFCAEACCCLGDGCNTPHPLSI